MKLPQNTVAALYRHYLPFLQEHYEEREAAVLLKRLIGHFLSLPLYKIPDMAAYDRLSESELLKIHFGIKDLLKFRPLEYILGEAEFYEMKFRVNESVLIPRPETEELTDLIWKTAGLKKDAKAIDIGTGSGCIAIVLQKLLHLKMTAVDKSAAALEVAKKNAERHYAEVELVEMDFLDENAWNFKDKFDLIVSNPPYVRASEKALMKANVLNHEPHTALFVPDDDPLIFYRKIRDFSQRYLSDKGQIFLEINEFLPQQTAALFKNHFAEIQLVRDLNGKQRFLKLKDRLSKA